MYFISISISLSLSKEGMLGGEERKRKKKYLKQNENLHIPLQIQEAQRN